MKVVFHFKCRFCNELIRDPLQENISPQELPVIERTGGVLANPRFYAPRPHVCRPGKQVGQAVYIGLTIEDE